MIPGMKNGVTTTVGKNNRQNNPLSLRPNDYTGSNGRGPQNPHLVKRYKDNPGGKAQYLDNKGINQYLQNKFKW